MPALPTQARLTSWTWPRTAQCTSSRCPYAQLQQCIETVKPCSPFVALCAVTWVKVYLRKALLLNVSVHHSQEWYLRHSPAPLVELNILYHGLALDNDTILAMGVPRNATLQVALGAPSQTAPSDTDDLQLIAETSLTVTVRLPKGSCS